MLVLMDRYLLILDELKADKPRRFDWLYHNRGHNIVGNLDNERTFTKKD